MGGEWVMIARTYQHAPQGVDFLVQLRILCNQITNKIFISGIS